MERRAVRPAGPAPATAVDAEVEKGAGRRPPSGYRLSRHQVSTLPPHPVLHSPLVTRNAVNPSRYTHYITAPLVPPARAHAVTSHTAAATLDAPLTSAPNNLPRHINAKCLVAQLFVGIVALALAGTACVHLLLPVGDDIDLEWSDAEVAPKPKRDRAAERAERAAAAEAEGGGGAKKKKERGGYSELDAGGYCTSRSVGPGNAFPECLLVVFRCTRTYSPRSPVWPRHSFPFHLNFTVFAQSVPL